MVLRPNFPSLLLTLSLALALSLPASSSAATIKETRTKMGSPFEITAVHDDPSVARSAIDQAFEEIDRLEAIISSWREDSETSAVNHAAGDHPVDVSPELFGLIHRALKVTEVTGGAFDITFASVGHLWDLGSEEPRKPSQSEIDLALENLGASNVVLDPERRSIFLRREGTRIGFGAIGKGFAANRAVAVMKAAGASGGVVNAGGDLLTFGRREDGRPWRVGIANPRDKGSVFAYLNATDQAVVTSGDYERFVAIDGKKYSHIIDPRTGYPAEELRSVTIVCPDAELADALATAVSVFGVEDGLALINRLKNVEGLLVDKDGKIHVSKNLKTLIEESEDSP